jgi:hypothetical protein
LRFEIIQSFYRKGRHLGEENFLTKIWVVDFQAMIYQWIIPVFNYKPMKVFLPRQIVYKYAPINLNHGPKNEWVSIQRYPAIN